MSDSKEFEIKDDGYNDDEYDSEYTYTDCSDDDYESEYTNTDYSESEEASGDSGRGSLGGKSSDSNIGKKGKSISEGFSITENDASPYSSLRPQDFSDDELKVAEIFEEWKEEIMNPGSDIVKNLQEEFGEHLPMCKVEADEEANKIVSLIGERDEEGNIHGEAEIYYDNGDYFWGDFNHGVKEGSASVVLKNGDNYMGVFKDNQLDGFVTESIGFCDRDNVTREVFYKQGVRHGYYREIGPLKQFWAIGRFSNGKKIGTHWRWAEGNSFLVGAIDEQNKTHGDFNIYLYPDLTTALVGHFDHGKMKTGHMVKLDSCRREFGIPIPQYCESREALKCQKYTFDQSTRICISKTPLLQDPYEKRHVFVKQSQIPFAGEGLWAKTDIKAGQLIALFNGVRQRHVWGVMAHNLAWSDYRINLEKDVDLDIYDEHIPIPNYKASLGHKACHSFNNNASFSPLWHPRFGPIMSVVANDDIPAGEEVFVTYNYMIAKSPEWYQQLWFDHLREDQDWSEEKIYSWANKELRRSGLQVEVLPPNRHSHRFLACGGCTEHVSQADESICCSQCLLWHHIRCSGLEEDIYSTESLEDWVCNSCTKL